MICKSFSAIILKDKHSKFHFQALSKKFSRPANPDFYSSKSVMIALKY